MAETENLRIVVCTTCRRRGTEVRPGADLIALLATALAEDDEGAADGDRPRMEVAGIACMAACARPCAVAFSAAGKSAYVFGDIETEADVAALADFARLYAERPDGWFHSGERPGGLLGKTVARIPAAGLVLATAEGAAS